MKQKALRVGDAHSFLLCMPESMETVDRKEIIWHNRYMNTCSYERGNYEKDRSRML